MRVRFTFKHMETSKGLVEIAESKFENLMRRFKPSPQRVNITVDTDGPFKKLHATIVTNDGRDIEAVVRGENAYSLVDELIQKLDSQLRKRKERSKFNLKGVFRSRHQRDGVLRANLSAISGFWSQAPIDAGDILKLSPENRGPLESWRAS